MTSPTVTTTKEDDLIAAADTAARVVGTILVALKRDLAAAGVQVRPVVESFITVLILDLPLTVPQIVDFCIYSLDHRRAITTWFQKITDEKGLAEAARQLDQALGNAQAIANLVNAIPEFTHLSWSESPTQSKGFGHETSRRTG